MVGKEMISFVDLAKSALERHPPLLDWIRSWTEVPDLEPLAPEGWFVEGHGIDVGKNVARPPRDNESKGGVWIPNHCSEGSAFLWAPPPAAADAALEELLKSRHKRTDLFHVVVVPRLLIPRWRRLFNKVCDFTLEVPVGHEFWPTSMFEPLWVGVVLPFSHHRPWCLKRAPALVDMGVHLRRVLASGESSGGDLLRQLWRLPQRLSRLSESLARGVLHMPRPRDLPHAED